MKKVITAAGLCLMSALGVANAQVKVGFMAPLSGSMAIVGQDQLDGFNLAVEQLEGKLGGQKATVIAEDDQLKPGVGVQIVRQFIGKDKVHAMAGLGLSNVMMAAFKPIVDSGIPAISTNAATSIVAGKSCAPNFFAVGWHNDGPAEAVGQYINDNGYEKVFMLAPNYQAGKDMFDAFKRFYDKPLLDEVFTQLGQTDYSSEISQIQSARPDAVFIFYPGAAGINFVKQFSQAGLSDDIPLFSVFSIDGTSLPSLREYANDAITGAHWDASFENEQSKQFVEAFQAKYKRVPSQFAAAGFDAAMLLDKAIENVGEDYTDKAKLTVAIKEAGSEFQSLRGDFRFNNNNMPVQNYYLFKVKDGTKTDSSSTEILGLALSEHSDAYAPLCSMR